MQHRAVFGGARASSRQYNGLVCSNKLHVVRSSSARASSAAGQTQCSAPDASRAAADTRRSFLLQLASGITAGPLLTAGPASAQNGFVTWWKSRRSANGGMKLLAPLYVAQRRLQEASDLLKQDSPPGSDDLTAALQLVRSSSLNCYYFEALPDDSFETKTSLFTQKYELSDPCTWRIVLKNTTDLEPVEVQTVAKEKLDALVLSYQHLDSLLDMAREGNTDAVPKAQEQIKATMLIAADIESFVKQTLGV